MFNLFKKKKVEVKEFDPNGINQYDENGKQHGYWEVYDEGGNLHYKGNFNHGERIGVHYNYYGWINKLKSEYNGDTGEYKEYHFNGKLAIKGCFIHKKKHGYWEEYYENGNLWYKGSYIHGNRHGEWNEHFDDYFVNEYYWEGEKINEEKYKELIKK